MKRAALINDEEIEVVVSDLHLPPNVDDISEGLALIDVARAQDPPLQVVVITGSDSKRAALEAVKRGAYGFFEKPLDPAELLHIVNQACANATTRNREPQAARGIVAAARIRSLDGHEPGVGTRAEAGEVSCGNERDSFVER